MPSRAMVVIAASAITVRRSVTPALYGCRVTTAVEEGWLMKAVIAGGGIGGLAAAAGLHKRGWDVTVLEQTAEFSVMGSGISLWENAFRALDTVGVELAGDRHSDDRHSDDPHSDDPH